MVEDYNEFMKKALNNVPIHLWNDYMSSNDREGSRKLRGRPGLKWLGRIQMTDFIVSQVSQK